jgi:carbamate kinase
VQDTVFHCQAALRTRELARFKRQAVAPLSRPAGSGAVGDAKRLHDADQFDRGSVGPKIQAVVGYLERGGKAGLITNRENISRALRGETGTRIVPD